jgi:hypothetical protein
MQRSPTIVLRLLWELLLWELLLWVLLLLLSI